MDLVDEVDMSCASIQPVTALLLHSRSTQKGILGLKFSVRYRLLCIPGVLSS